MSLRSLLPRLARIEREIQSQAPRRLDYGPLREKLEALAADAASRTPQSVAELVEEERTKFEKRREELRSGGPRAEIYAQLTAISGAPDPRRFDTADEYAAAFGAWLEASRSATAAGRTPADASEGRDQ